MAFPTTAVLDSGTGANADPIGGNWTKLLANVEITRVSNKIAGPNSGVGDDYWNVSVTSSADCEAYATVDTLYSLFEDIRLYLRMTGVSGNGYMGIWAKDGSNNDNWAIYKVTGGTGLSLLTSGTLGVGVMTAADKVGIEIIGTTIKLYRKAGAGAWAQIASASTTDATYSAAGYVGVTMNGPNARLINIGGGPFASPPVNTVAPVVTFTGAAPMQDSSLTSDGGTFTGTDGAITKTYAYYRDYYGSSGGAWGGGTEFAAIPSGDGGTTNPYVMTIADVGCYLACVTTATDSNGATTAVSNVVGLVVACPDPVVAVVALGVPGLSTTTTAVLPTLGAPGLVT